MIEYRTRYRYPWRWAILAELCWRLEHLPIGGPFYRWRKAAERHGHRMQGSGR